jgi:type VI secretion system secreted protein VgrG
VISANDQITVAAQKQLLVTAAGAYIKLEGGNIYIHAPGMIDIKGAQHSFGGPTSLSRAMNTWPQTSFDEEFVLTYQHNGEPVANRRFEIKREDGSIIRGASNAEGRTGLQKSLFLGKVTIKLLPRN